VQDAHVQQTRFGERFHVRAESGTGGMATVYRATDARTGQDVALKVLHDTVTSSAERFNQEASLLAELAHPAIVRYVDHGTTSGGERFLAMEWLVGETLEARLARGPLGILESLRLGRRVLEGLAVAHRKGIVHRDLKPPNIFLPDGDLARVKILDFGIARRTADTRRFTLTGSSLGTPGYMSPEQVRGARTIDARSDVFSLGCVLYECVTGEAPFAGETALAIMARICLDESVSVEARWPELPAAVAALLTRMLAKDPQARPASAADLAAEMGDLARALAALGHVTKETAVRVARASVPHLAPVEQRVVCAILISRSQASEESGEVRAGTWDVPASTSPLALTDVFDEATLARIQQAVAPFGAHLDVLLRTALAVTLVGEGTPTDLAAQAGRCALVLKGLLPRVCFAVATGRAVVGEDALGGLVAGAARLLGGGEPGAIRLDEVTATLLESRFQIRAEAAPDGPRRQLLFEKGLKEAPRTVLGKDTPCVGREREIGTLLGLWDEATGEPVARAVLVTAPPGAGKSRVRHELVDRIQARAERFELLIGRGDSVRAGAPFAVLRPALRAAAGLVGGEPAAVQQKRILAHVERHVPAPIARRVAAFIGEIADVPFADHDLPQLRAARQDPRLMADQTLGAWLDFIEAECAAHPVLLVLEDLHWGDGPSVQLIDAALRTLRGRPLLVLAFARPEVDDRFPGLWFERDLQRMALAPLTARSALKLVEHILGELPAEKAAWIVERADGNPFYLEELVRAVGDGAGPETGQPLPDTVIGMVQARFDALGSDAKRVLRAGAVFGHVFRASGVRALVGDDDRSLHQWLDILAKKEVIFPRQAADTGEFVFRHALVEEAAYAMLAPEDRVLGHRLAGEHLEREGERAAIVLVEHFEKGAEPAKAAYWCRFAAEEALEANDLAMVIERAARGVRLGAEGESLGAMRVAEAQARFWRGEYREAEGAALEATQLLVGVDRLRAVRELVAALGQQAKFAEVESWGLGLLERPPLEAVAMGAWLDCLVRAAGYLLPGGCYGAARKLLEEVERRKEYLEPVAAARLHGVRAGSAWHEGHHTTTLSEYESAARAYESLGDVRSVTEMLGNVGAALGDLGLLEQAEEKLTAVLSASERMDLGFVSVVVLMNLCQVRAHLGHFDQGRAAGEQAMALARKQGDPRIEGVSSIYLCTSACLQGHFAEAEAYARAATKLLENIVPILPGALAALSNSLLCQHKWHEALGPAEEAYRLLEVAGRVEDGEAAIRLAYAECLGAVGREREAEGVVRDAWQRLTERATAIQDPSWREKFMSRLPTHARTAALVKRLASHGAS
jgi:eukaryotic-like serine/threonine-protein kinase